MSEKKTLNQSEEDSSWYQDLYDWLQMLTFILVAIVLIFTFFAQVIVVSGHSMYPTLHNRDIMLVQRGSAMPETGDVVVIHKESAYPEAIVKRVIATAGQEVELNYEDNLVYVDGVALDEPYINFEDEDPMFYTDDMVYQDFIVPEGSIFVMGDNRNHSSDSRFIRLGMVDTRCIVGKVQFVVFPFTHFGVY